MEPGGEEDDRAENFVINHHQIMGIYPRPTVQDVYLPGNTLNLRLVNKIISAQNTTKIQDRQIYNFLNLKSCEWKLDKFYDNPQSPFEIISLLITVEED